MLVSVWESTMLDLILALWMFSLPRLKKLNCKDAEGDRWLSVFFVVNQHLFPAAGMDHPFNCHEHGVMIIDVLLWHHGHHYHAFRSLLWSPHVPETGVQVPAEPYQ